MLTEEQINKKEREYLAKPEADVIFLSPRCDGVSLDGRQWSDHTIEDCPDCGMKPVKYIRADLVLKRK